MSELTLIASERTVTKASQLNELRAKNQVPGVIYGHGQKNHNISVDYNTVVKLINQAGFSQVINLTLAGKNLPVILRAYQRDPVSERLIHVDFLLVDAKRPLTTIVPLVFIGTSNAVRELGGKLEIKKDKIKVKCLAADLPAKVEVDLSSLAQIGSDIKVSGLPVGPKVKILDPANDPVVDVIIPKKEEPVAGAVATPAEGEAPAAEGEAPAADVQSAPEKGKTE